MRTPQDYQNRLVDWVRLNPGRLTVGKSDLSVLFRSRRVGHAVLAAALDDQLLAKADNAVIQITEKLFRLAGTELQSGDHELDKNEGTLRGEPVVAGLEPCSDLRLNQLPKKNRTPRRQYAVSRNRRKNALSAELSTAKTQFLETANTQFLENANTANHAKSLTISKCPKSLAAPYLEETSSPKESADDEEILLNNNTLSLPEKINRASGQAGARSKLRTKAAAAGKQRKLDTLKERAKQYARVKQDTGTSPLQGAETGFVPDNAEDSARAHSMAVAYESAMQEYRNNRFLKVFKGSPLLYEKTYGYLLRAAQFADELGVDYETYIKAQFWAMHEWYKRSPKLHHIASFKSKVPSKERVTLYLAAIRKGAVSAERQVRGISRRAPRVSLSVRFQNSERQLKRLMKTYQETEEQILCRFATTSSYFDREWLMANDTYRRLSAEGRI